MVAFSEQYYLDLTLAEITGSMADVATRLHEITKESIKAWGGGSISDAALEEIRAAIEARRGRQRKAATDKLRIGHTIQKLAGVTAAVESSEPKTRTSTLRAMTAEERQFRDERTRRRRYVARVGRMPGLVAQMFTTGEQAVLAVIAYQDRKWGSCKLSVDAIALRAKVCRRLVQVALRKASSFGFLLITRRRKNTSIVRVMLDAWRNWNGRGKAEKGDIGEYLSTLPMGAETCVSGAAEPVEVQTPNEPAKVSDVIEVKVGKIGLEPWGEITTECEDWLVQHCPGRFRNRFIVEWAGEEASTVALVQFHDLFDATAFKFRWG